MASSEFRPLDEKSLVEYIKATPRLLDLLGEKLEALTIKEVGDGNLNFVYIVVSATGSVVIKQALPYIRCIGESWPMTRERAYFEALALKEHGHLCPEHVPEVYHFDRIMSLIAMRYLKPPHIILRKGLIAGIEYPLLAENMSEYMAKTLFSTSLLYHSTAVHKKAVAEFCGNMELCRHTGQVVFSDPYKVSQYNHWTAPYLDHDAEAVRADNTLKLEVAELKSMFCERAQALIHGDLHTGSIMVTTDSTQVIDPEFAFYGPMGFDIGAFLGNLILAFFAQDGHASEANDRKIVLMIEALYPVTTFSLGPILSPRVPRCNPPLLDRVPNQNIAPWHILQLICRGCCVFLRISISPLLLLQLYKAATSVLLSYCQGIICNLVFHTHAKHVEVNYHYPKKSFVRNLM